MTTRATETGRTTESIQEAAERLTLQAFHNPNFTPCLETATRIIRAVESGGFLNRFTPMTQVEKLIDHMRDVGPISQREAYLEYDIQSFHRRLSDIRQLGMNLKAYPKKNPVTGQHYTRYGLEPRVG